ncbi:MAG TPA: TOBE domain-containing protein, partial [Streptosporangiaceae bacterium]|nr:TOBE domain-containing protein [Streptosporangiaceae bacterium]
PSNVFVAGFIGSPAMNRFDATADSDGIHLGLATLRPSDAQLRAAQGHDKLIIGVRPEHLSVGDGDGELTVKVALVEDLGSDSFIYGRLADDESSSVIVRSGRDHPRHGDTVKVGVDTTHLHIFDADTGLRLGE